MPTRTSGVEEMAKQCSEEKTIEQTSTRMIDNWIQPLSRLVADNPKQSEPIIDRLLRRGETMNVIAAPKMGKSWLVHGLAYAVANGQPWLGHECKRGKVLLLDAELHRQELANRLALVCGKSTANIDIVSLRGRMMDIEKLASRVKATKHGKYAVIVLDALYRFLPSGCSENDNAAMMRVYNVLDAIAESTGASVVVVHHSSKGDQSVKSITDMGSGAGSIARATDTHLAIRPHEQVGLAVVQAVCRSFESADDMTVRWVFPRWERVLVEPQLATRTNANEVRQKKLDDEADKALREALQGKRLSIAQLRKLTLFGKERIERGLKRLGAIGKRATNKRTGKVAERFRLPD